MLFACCCKDRKKPPESESRRPSRLLVPAITGTDEQGVFNGAQPPDQQSARFSLQEADAVKVLQQRLAASVAESSMVVPPGNTSSASASSDVQPAPQVLGSSLDEVSPSEKLPNTKHVEEAQPSVNTDDGAQYSAGLKEELPMPNVVEPPEILISSVENSPPDAIPKSKADDDDSTLPHSDVFTEATEASSGLDPIQQGKVTSAIDERASALGEGSQSNVAPDTVLPLPAEDAAPGVLVEPLHAVVKEGAQSSPSLQSEQLDKAPSKESISNELPLPTSNHDVLPTEASETSSFPVQPSATTLHQEPDSPPATSNEEQDAPSNSLVETVQQSGEQEGSANLIPSELPQPSETGSPVDLQEEAQPIGSDAQHAPHSMTPERQNKDSNVPGDSGVTESASTTPRLSLSDKEKLAKKMQQRQSLVKEEEQ